MGVSCHTQPMEQRTDRLTATYVDLAVNVSITFGLEAGMRVLQHKAPLLVVQRVLIEGGPRRGPCSATSESS
jgi:hypothetical protein